jgi:small-conductance mechanosensitive channel
MRTIDTPKAVVPTGALGLILGLALVLSVCAGTWAQPSDSEPSIVTPEATEPADATNAVEQADAATKAKQADGTETASSVSTTAPPRSLELVQDDERWSITGALLTIWNAELFSASGSPVKLNQIVMALLIILVGLWISKRVALMVRTRLSRIQRIDSHAAAVIQTVVFNTMAVIIILAAMPIAGIPATIFTVLGGAVAIGIGFGAQNLFNNLISGLIIMLERPIRLGDIVQVGDHEGLIEAINNRCTTIRRSDGIDLLVPNSHFLEQPVVNWTLSDRDVRGSVVVGVAYGSPTDQVARFLRQCLDEHTLIHERPEPVVLFQDFGDNALVFEAYFWSRIRRPMDLNKIQSDIRFRFDELAREAGIAIAFPQRDVHLDTLRPLEVKVVSDGG